LTLFLLKDHGEKRGRDLIRAGLEVFGISAKDLKTAAKSDWRKGILAEMVQRETTMTLNRISEKLVMGIDRVAVELYAGHDRK